MVLLKLFYCFGKIGFFAIGGAYSFLPLIEAEVVEKYSWISREEFLDVMGITQVLPGAISVKYATYIGYKVAGIPGIVIANLGHIFAPALLIVALSAVYGKFKDSPHLKGAFDMIRVAVFAMIIAVAFNLIGAKNLLSLKTAVFSILFMILFFWGKIHPALLIILAGFLGIVLK